MAKKSDKGAILRAAEDGDELAKRLARDIAEEEGAPVTAEPFQEGDWIAIYTATHYFVGQLVGENYEEWVLKNVVQVYETGSIEIFYNEGVASYCQKLPIRVLHVRKGGTVYLTDWPLQREPTMKKDTEAETEADG